MTKRWLLRVDDDGILTFPDEVLIQLGWKEGDDLDFKPKPDNTIVVTKVTTNATTELNQGEPDPQTVS